MKEKKIHSLLRRDVLYEVEKMTGGSYQAEGTLTHELAMASFIEHRETVNQTLRQDGDTHSQSTVSEYLFIAQCLGFEIMGHYPFKSHPYGDAKAVDEDFLILWRAGILLTVDTYGGQKVNAADFDYNWRPHDPKDIHYGFGSGYSIQDGDSSVVIGHMDAREGFRNQIRLMESLGTFLPTWREKPSLWLVHHGDTKQPGYSHATINAARIAALPADVRKSITP